MRPIASDVARGVYCLCVGQHARDVQKRLNQSRCRLGADSCEPKDACIRPYMGVEIPTGRDNFGGCPAH